MKVEDLAQIVHNANKTYCETMGDFSIPMWRMAPPHMVKSTIDGVLNVLANPKTTPEESHANWMKFKEAAGWKYGPQKREEYKTHPCMVPYEDLPDEQKLKDQLFIDIVLVFADQIDPREVAAYKVALKKGPPKKKGAKMNPADEEAINMDKKK